ncbi:hydroxymethylbilane synthase [Bordetella bronchiseptica B18-5 (C3)]|nr:hydroxymethylbilane synthase [Bordetella bronchiseptica B18-5 (C3)]
MAAVERLTIATRASRLALWQAEHVRDLLRARYPACSVELLTLTTRGDQILDPPCPRWAARACSSRNSKPPCSTAAPISRCIRSRTCRWTCTRRSS